MLITFQDCLEFLKDFHGSDPTSESYCVYKYAPNDKKPITVISYFIRGPEDFLRVWDEYKLHPGTSPYKVV